MAEIAEQIGTFLARGTGPTEHRLKYKLAHTFLPNWPLKNFDPITLQAAEIIGGLFATE